MARPVQLAKGAMLFFHAQSGDNFVLFLFSP